jgi:phosphatidylethanolamine/phosphatidyl-N-methylethanolamine N-methyltransferase
VAPDLRERRRVTVAPPLPLAEWSERLRFLGRFFRSPRTVGALAPSSQWLARAMVAPLAHGGSRAVPAGPTIPGRPIVVVELGPGTGAFTRAIVARLGPADRLLCVETDPTFVEALRRRWPDVDCACASAESLPALLGERGLGPVDHIASGLPFATLPAQTTGRILEAVGTTLRPGGTFTTFHYVQSYAIPAAIAFRRQMSGRMGSAPSVQFVARNLPPAFVLSWTNRRASPVGPTGP